MKAVDPVENSATVATVSPEAQELLKVQPVLPQKRPSQPVEAWTAREVPLGISNPVLWGIGWLPEMVRVAAQTVSEQLFTNLNFVPPRPGVE